METKETFMTLSAEARGQKLSKNMAFITNPH